MTDFLGPKRGPNIIVLLYSITTKVYWNHCIEKVEMSICRQKLATKMSDIQIIQIDIVERPQGNYLK